MRKAAVLATVFALMLCLAVPGTAFGWANGADLNGDGVGDDGYGTHDWILDRAITLAGQGGAWVDRTAALRATDDPDDPKTGTPGNLHTFRQSGLGQGGPQAIADAYALLLSARASGNSAEASRQLGILAHYYGDLSQPFHTYDDDYTPAGMHSGYEQSADGLTGSYSDSPGWAPDTGRRTVTDIRAKAISSALYSRARYPELVQSLRYNDGRIAGAGSRITGEVLGRAVNDLADIVAAVPSGAGQAASPARIDCRMGDPRYYYPRNGQKVRAIAVATDANGKPMEGVGITFRWPFGSYPSYTDANGVAWDWQVLGSYPYMGWHAVTATYSSGGMTVSDGSGFRTSPTLGTGQAGVRTTVSNSRPKRGTTVKATTRFLDTKGRPVAGLPVNFSWYFRGGTVKVRAITNANGYAVSSRNIGRSPLGVRVYVKGQAYCGGVSRSSQASFVPQ